MKLLKDGLQTCDPSRDHERRPVPEHELKQYAAILKALSHPVRLRMVELIDRYGGDLCVCEFEQHFDLTQPTISHHLKILREAGVIRSRQDGPWVRHSVEADFVALMQELVSALSGRECAAPTHKQESI